MGITPSYPGIYIQELPSSAHTITAAPTSVTVFVGYTHPFQTVKFGAPTELFSFSDYERLFGGTYQSDLIDCNVANAVNQFFLNGGSDAFVVGIKPAQYTDNQGDANSKNITAKGAVTAATLEFGANPNGIVFTALEPVDSVPMTVTISNPQTSQVPVSVPITKITEAGAVATVTLGAAIPNIAIGDSITISGNSVPGYNGNCKVVQVNSTTKFTFAATVSVPITKITEAGAVATVTLGAAIPNIAIGDSITISGNSVPGYNGNCKVVQVNSTTKFTFAATGGLADGVGGTASDSTPHAGDIDTADIAISYGNQTETYRKLNLIPSDPNFIATRIGGTVALSINAIARLGNIVTVTTSVNHGFAVGDTIAIAGVGDASFDGSFVVASAPTGSPNQFTYLQSAANAASNGGTASYTVSPVSSLVTVSPDTAYPSAYPFPANQSTMSVSTTFSAPGGAVGVWSNLRPGVLAGPGIYERIDNLRANR